VRNWRVVTAVVTVVAAVLAFVLSFAYLRHADERAQDKVKQVEVLVARETIPAGTLGSTAVAEGLIGPDKIEQKNVPVGAVSVSDPGAIGSLVAGSDIPKGEVIASGLFVSTQHAGGTLTAQLKPGDQAMSFTVDPSHGVANLIQVGDSINVIASIKVIKEKSVLDPNAAGATAQFTAFLIPGLKVLAVGTSTQAPSAPPANTSGSTTPTTTANRTPANLGLITVEVTPRQAEQLAHAQFYGGNGTLYLTLNAPGFDPAKFRTPTEIVDIQNLFDQKLNLVDRTLAQLP